MLMHIPNDVIIGMWSMVLAAEWLPQSTWSVGGTIRLEAATPNEHINRAPLTPCLGMAVFSLSVKLRIT
jgi:hypothetical protein